MRVSLAIVAVIVVAGCGPAGPHRDSLPGLTLADHTKLYFPIDKGPHAVDCAQCHTNSATFTEFNCGACHQHEPIATGVLHGTVAKYSYTSVACFSCHPKGVQVPIFDHATGKHDCALCHDAGAAFAAFPASGHPDRGGADCGACHLSTTNWADVSAFPPGLVADPNQTVSVNALVATYAGTSIASVSALVEAMPMSMDHATSEVSSTIVSSCTNCHSDAVNFYPGSLHSALANLGEAQPAHCADCHVDAMPVGFVGPIATNPARTPSSGEMKHDAVAWANDAPTNTALVPLECGTCHVAPTQNAPSTWQGVTGGAGALYHASLASASIAQPSSCIDCHANSRPSGGAALLTHANAESSLPAGVTFDHTSTFALSDCTACHAASASANGTASAFSAWSGGTFHNAGDALPSTCLPCHEGERPTTTSTWVSVTFNASPFDFVTNANGVTHGDGLDCVACHSSTTTFAGGAFDHGVSTVAGTTCIACHTTQRADLVLGSASLAASKLGFDHATSGTGDCFGCHAATVASSSYVHLLNPSTNTLPGGDWSGGIAYPGNTLVGAQDQFVTLTALTNVNSGSPALVRSTTTTTATLYNEMLHTASEVPASIAPGPPPGNASTCFHCHTHDANNNVTSFANGQYHAALTSLSLAQPSTCGDCHVQMRPVNVVEHNGSNLEPMDHAASFTASVTIGGRSASGVSQVDCGVCHRDPGGAWSGAKFHANIGAAVPSDCTTCHAVLELDAAKSDVTNGANFAMTHSSSQVTIQNCAVCHASALAKATQTPPASTQWSGAALHANVSTQPASCADCHASDAPSTATQSSVTYALAAGATATNGAQWMSHAASFVVGKDCASCHLADATANVTTWSKSDLLHAKVANVNACAVCHGNGSTPGTNNNMPAGLTNSSTTTSAASDATTGVSAGTHDQITHGDVNVSSHDCNFCHSQVGPGGKNWAAAQFHVSFNASNPLVMNTTTGRCSSCHLNVKPGASFTGFDHGSFNNTSGSTDCSSCHSWPGTGTSTSPNWLGAAGGYPTFIAVGGFAVPQPPAPNATTTEGAVANLPHPNPGSNACTACHASSSGGKNAIGYDHASPVENNHCSACHEAGSNLIGTAYNGSTSQGGGAGDSRPFAITSLKATFSGHGSLTINSTSCPGGFPCGNHFAGVDCYQCHNAPTGVAHAQPSGGAYTTAWTFPHNESRMSNPSTCHLCHGNNIP